MSRTQKAADTIEEWLGEPMWDFLAKSAGVGLAGTAVEIIRGQGWAEGVGDEILEAAVGLLAVKYGDRVHEQLPNVGRGVLYHLVGRVLFEERVAPMFTSAFGKAGGQKAALTKAFQQKYQRSPSSQEMNSMLQALKQRQNAPAAAPAVQIQQKGLAQAAIVEDFHYS